MPIDKFLTDGWTDQNYIFRIWFYLYSLMYDLEVMCRKKVDTPVVYLLRFYGIQIWSSFFWNNFVYFNIWSWF